MAVIRISLDQKLSNDTRLDRFIQNSAPIIIVLDHPRLVDPVLVVDNLLPPKIIRWLLESTRKHASSSTVSGWLEVAVGVFQKLFIEVALEVVGVELDGVVAVGYVLVLSAMMLMLMLLGN